GSRAQASLQKAQRRNFQIGGTKKRAAVPQYETGPQKNLEPAGRAAAAQTTPTTRAGRKHGGKKGGPGPRAGQPCAGSKLDEALTRELCGLLEDQMTLEDACAMVGIQRNAVWEWRTKGQSGEHPAYEAFEAAISQALINAKHALVKRVANHTD